ncbi:MAG: hypothetical protein U1A27_01000 [Phycisphaerae bacterium]
MQIDLARLFPRRVTLAAEPDLARALPAHGGVYLLADAAEQTILLAACEDLRRVVPARLAASDGRSRRARLGEIAATLWFRPTFSQFETALRYLDTVRLVHPHDYRKRLGFGPAWFIRGEAGATPPRLRVVCECLPGPADHVGPYAARSDADAVVAELDDLFDLCRKLDVLRQAPHGRACEYLEMGRCPAPCDGRFPMADYARGVNAALRFAAGDRAPRLAALETNMRQSAARLAFERAGDLKRRMERAAALFARRELQLAGDLDRFGWLIVQRAGPRSSSRRRLKVKPFRVTARQVVEGSPVGLDEVEAAAPHWLAPPTTAGDAPPAEAVAASEQLWCVAHFLFKRPAARGLYYAADALPSAALLAADAEREFLRRPEPQTGEAAPIVSEPPDAPESPSTPDETQAAG